MTLTLEDIPDLLQMARLTKNPRAQWRVLRWVEELLHRERSELPTYQEWELDASGRRRGQDRSFARFRHDDVQQGKEVLYTSTRYTAIADKLCVGHDDEGRPYITGAGRRVWLTEAERRKVHAVFVREG